MSRQKNRGGDPNVSPSVIEAHKHCTDNRLEMQNSETCGCFCCCRIFKPSEIFQWCDEDKNKVEQTAICPHCSIDSLIASSSGFPITVEFLEEMERHWFSIR